MTQDRLLTVVEAASHVGLRHAALRRAIQRGELPAVKLCGRIRIRPDELENWVRDSQVDVHCSATELASKRG